MVQLSLWHWAIVLLVVVLIFGTRTSGRDAESHRVFSAFTVRGKEAEYVNERLPRKLVPVMLVAAALMALVLLAWSGIRP